MQIWIIIIAFLVLVILLMFYEEKNEREKIKKVDQEGVWKKAKKKTIFYGKDKNILGRVWR